jgi:1,5-anhydro-D-fructose reductase (1,5-anhydro-D-mannitol-forming)
VPEQNVKWVIVGCGRVTERRIAPAFRGLEGVELLGFCARNVGRARVFADQAGGGARAYGSLDEVLADRRVNAIYLATPNALHAEQAIACLKAGRHVLTDKPMATTAADAQRMLETAQASKQILGVMHQARFHPANLHLIRLIDEGSLGTLTAIRVQIGIWYPPGDNWRLDPAVSGGGAAMDLGPHGLDLMLEIGGPVARVSAWTGNLRFNYRVEDFCHARLEFARGGIGLLEVGYCVRAYGGRIEVYGSAGTFVADGSLQIGRSYHTSLRLGDAQGPTETRADNEQDPFAAALDDFSDAVRARREPTVTAADGVAVMEVLAAMYRSAQSGQPETVRPL